MSSTDELKALLDERNVEYKDRDMFGQHVFHWGEPLHGAMFTVSLSGEWTELVVENPTPQQAVEATLGRAGCKIEHRRDGWYCTGCGDLIGSDDPDSELFVDGNVIELWDFCPYCGRRVKR